MVNAILSDERCGGAMESQLLATKFQIPPRPRWLVQRGHLLDRLNDAILSHKVTSVAAPAGYGKTSLLTQWARDADAAVAWLTLGAQDSDARRFFRYFFKAWERAQSDVSDSALGILLGSQAPELEAVLSACVNVAVEAAEQTVVVLDDYHLIEDEAVHESVAFLIEHLPTTMHLVLAGRSDPPLPLARYRARNQLHELRADDLCFTVEETAEFARACLGLHLNDEQARDLHQRTEGWVAGLQLAALTHGSQAADGDIEVSGRQRFIADYFGEDVLADQPDAVRRFLLDTSILVELSGPLCDAVTGSANGQEMLEALERERLFLVPLDNDRNWFRYHRLFSEFLLETMIRRRPDEIATLHRRASHWYLAHGLTEQAFSHAIEARDAALVTDIVEQDYFARLLGGEMIVARRWIESMPPAWFDEYPILAVARAGLVLMTSGLDACASYLDIVEGRLRQEHRADTSAHLARVSAVRCFIACFSNDVEAAERYADQATEDLPVDEWNLRPGIFGALGDTYRRNGLWDNAQRVYRQLLDFSHAPTFRSNSAHVYGALADLELRQGRLNAAAAYWQSALHAIDEQDNWGRIPLPVIGWVFIRTGELYYERDDLSRAWDYISKGLERAELGGDVKAMLAGYLVAGRLKLTEGDVESALEYLERARPLAVDSPDPEWLGRFERLQLEVWLAQDHLRAAMHWADDAMEGDALLRRPDSEPAQLALARALLVRGDPSSRERAAEQIDLMLDTAERDGRTGLQIEALALQAMVWWMRGDRAEAMVSLERGLSLAEPEGYVRLFADLGLAIVPLFQEARSREIMPAYVAQLLSACGDRETPIDAPLAVPLTEREHEVLTMISAGLTNPEIADRLFISAETVKKHAGSIYGKLGVHTRTEAASRARELNLLR